jgi:hypothetical protein
MSNSFASVQNLNDYTNVSASSAQIISLSVNAFTNGPLTYYNVIGYTPASFPPEASLSTINGALTTTTANALVIPAGAYITSISLTNNGIPIESSSGFISLEISISPNIGGDTLIANIEVSNINTIGYSTILEQYVAHSVPLYISVIPTNVITAGSLCAYITYVMATNSPTP